VLLLLLLLPAPQWEAGRDRKLLSLVAPRVVRADNCCYNCHHHHHHLHRSITGM
jgi:hypothetical protein